MKSLKDSDAFKYFIEEEIKAFKGYETPAGVAYKRGDLTKFLYISSIDNYICKLNESDKVNLKLEGAKKSSVLITRSGVCKIISMMKKKPEQQKLDYFNYKEGEFTVIPNFSICKKQIKAFFKEKTYQEGSDFITVDELKFLFTYAGNDNTKALAKQFPSYKIMYAPIVRTINAEFKRFMAIVITELLAAK